MTTLEKNRHIDSGRPQ